MPAVDVVVETAISNSVRARQLRAMFDVPVEKKCTLQWQGELPIEQEDWNVGLIVGPSGSGKTTVARSTFGENFHPDMEWRAASVIDDFAAGSSMESISKACQAVGFNTIPAWLRPHSVLSNGEKFRVELARRVLELPDPVVVDEFTSVVDRQVAQIGAYAVAKWVRRERRKFVAVTCHYDVIEWLQPDWILEPATMKFTARRGLQRSRPGIDVEIGRGRIRGVETFRSVSLSERRFEQIGSVLRAFRKWNTCGLRRRFTAAPSKGQRHSRGKPLGDSAGLAGAGTGSNSGRQPRSRLPRGRIPVTNLPSAPGPDSQL